MKYKLYTGWVNTDTCLPYEDGQYLVVSMGKTGPCLVTAHYTTKHRRFVADGRVTHWRALPSLPAIAEA